MFNNLTPKNSPEVDDIFAGVEPEAPAVSSVQPIPPRTTPIQVQTGAMPTRTAAPVMPNSVIGQMPNTGMSDDTKNKMAKAIKTLIITVIVMALVLLGSYVVFKQFLAPALSPVKQTPATSSNQINTPVTNNPVVNTPVVNSIPSTSAPVIIPSSTLPEVIATTTTTTTSATSSAKVDCSLAATASPANIILHQLDSDHDGLSNYDEICIYHTDPNKADTDGDGYDDGAEVKGGYNPNGPGKLIK